MRTSSSLREGNSAHKTSVEFYKYFYNHTQR